MEAPTRRKIFLREVAGDALTAIHTSLKTVSGSEDKERRR
jgi:hypothetical protein